MAPRRWRVRNCCRQGRGSWLALGGVCPEISRNVGAAEGFKIWRVLPPAQRGGRRAGFLGEGALGYNDKGGCEAHGMGSGGRKEMGVKLCKLVHIARISWPMNKLWGLLGVGMAGVLLIGSRANGHWVDSPRQAGFPQRVGTPDQWVGQQSVSLRFGYSVSATEGGLVNFVAGMGEDGRAEAVKQKAASEGAEVSPKQIARWIEQLGDDSYRVREEATAALGRAGLAAAEALKAALRHPDLEVRRRARWILGKVLEEDHRQRLEKFLADPTGSAEHQLPLWRRYRELVGYDEGARKLFAAMQRAEPALLEAVEEGGSAGVESVRARLQQMIQRMHLPVAYRPSLGTTAALLFVMALPELELPRDLVETPYVYNLVHQEGLQRLLGGPDRGEKAAARRLLGLWILRPVDLQAGQVGWLHHRLQIAIQYRLPEGLVLAVDLLQAKQALQPHGYIYAQAVSAIGLLGGEKYAEHLVPILEDTQECARIGINNRQIRIEVRDVALAWLVHLTKQKHADYGMPEAEREFERLERMQRYFPNFAAFRYAETASRQKAIQKLKAWLAEHPLPKSPALPKRSEASKANQARSAPAQQVGLPLAGQGPVGVPKAHRSGQPLEPEKNPSNVFLPRADRLLVRRLIQAEQAIGQGRWAEAVPILGDILADPQNYAFQPEATEPLYRTIKSEAARLLEQMPPEGLQTYQTLYESRARAALEAAARRGDLEQLQAVVERFFFTRSGAEALYLVGRALLDRGQPLQAALAARRLRRHHQATEWEPTVSVLEAVAWYGAGDLAAAESALRELAVRLPGQRFQWAGREEKLVFQPNGELAWLQEKLGLPKGEKPPQGWLFVHANAAQDRSGELGMPYLWPVAHWPTCPEPLLEELACQIRRQFHEELQPALFRPHPLVVGNKVIFCTSTQLQAVDLKTGQIAWKAPIEDPLRLFLAPYENRLEPGRRITAPATSGGNRQTDGKKLSQILAALVFPSLDIFDGADSEEEEWEERNLSAERLREILAEGLQERFWADTGFGLLSTDGHRVYALEDVSFHFPVQFQRVVVTADGRRRPEPLLQKNYNLLVAYDLRTGKAVWELGGPPDVAGTKLAGAYFLGPPLPLGGRVYAVALFEEQTCLFELAANTGQVLSQLPLSSPGPAEPITQPAGLLARGIALKEGWPEQLPCRMAAYADGILVCPTAREQYVAVDLLGRRIRWIYEAAQEEQEDLSWLGRFVAVPAPIRRAYTAWKQQNDRWLEAGIFIGEGHVVLSVPGSNKLICLRLEDGHRQWAVPRKDGLFVAAVAQGKVVVVGRESIWAVRLQDGQSAWPSGPVAMPAGAMPAGRGYRNGPYYYLPLTTGEVAAFDLQWGRLVARSRSPQGLIPGNLVACNGVILSQDGDGLYWWESLEQRAKQTAARLVQSPHNVQALLEHAEVLLAQGEWKKCLDLLEQGKSALEQPGQVQRRFHQLLLAAVQDGFLLNPEGLVARLEQIQRLWGQTAEQPQLLELIAQAYHHQGQLEAAFDTYLRLLRQAPNLTQQYHWVNTAHKVRKDRWIAARLAELYQKATPPIRTRLDAKLAEWKQPNRQEEFVRYFGFHPDAQQVRLALAEQYLHSGRLLEAEWLLQTVVEQAEEAQQAEAAVRLAQLYRKAGRYEAAAAVYRVLAGRWGERLCADGKTGRELLEALPAADPVRSLLSQPPPWPSTPPRVETLSSKRGLRYTFLVSLGQRSSLLPPVVCRFDPNQHELQIQFASGRKLEPIRMARPPGLAGVNHNLYTHCQGVQRGHMLISWLGTMVAGVNLLSEPGQVLWTQPTMPTQLPHPMFAGVLLARAPLRQAGPFLASQPLPLVVTSHMICFQREGKLVAVDPLVKEDQATVWTRTDLQDQADLFGDEELLFVTETGQEEALVLSSLDGRTLGKRRVPEIKDRLLVQGRYVLCWRPNPQSCQAMLVDPWTERLVWSRAFPPKSQPWILLEQGCLAVLAPSGAFMLLDLQTGQEVFQASLDPEPDLDSLVVLASNSQYIVIANRSFEHSGPIFFPPQMADTVPVHGRLSALDRQTGQVLWSTEVLQQRLRLGVPAELPILVFHNVSYKQTRNPKGALVQQIGESLLCVDTRTGTVVHQIDRPGVSGFGYEIVSDLQERSIDITTARETIRLHFGAP